MIAVSIRGQIMDRQKKPGSMGPMIHLREDLVDLLIRRRFPVAQFLRPLKVHKVEPACPKLKILPANYGVPPVGCICVSQFRHEIAIIGWNQDPAHAQGFYPTRRGTQASLEITPRFLTKGAHKCNSRGLRCHLYTPGNTSSVSGIHELPD